MRRVIAPLVSGLQNSVRASILVVVSMMFAVSSEAVEIYSTSFESPDISGRVTTKPDGWLGGSYGTRREGLEDVDNGTFTTPYGSQAASIWNTSSETVLTTAESTFGDTLVADITYTVTCHVAKAPDMSGYYSIKLMAFVPGAFRQQYRDPGASEGAVLAVVTGTASTSDMSQVATLTFTANASNANLGRMLAIRFSNPSVCLFDNLTFSRSGPAGDIEPPIITTTYPRDNATTMDTAYKLILSFNEPITKGTGNITVKRSADDSTVETIDVTSGQVTIDGAVVSVTRNEVLEHDTSYYVNIDSTAFVDLSANAYRGISNKTTFDFRTPVAEGSAVIYETSFESPVVSGRVIGLPDGWQKGSYGAQNQAIENVDTGTYTTPWGSQAVCAGGAEALLTTKESTFDDRLQADFPYTVTFNVARPTNGSSGAYKVQLMVYPEGAARNNIYGTSVAQAAGTATESDMSAQAVGFTFTAAENNVHLGKMLAIEIDQTTLCLVDNLKLTWVGPPPAGTLLWLR